MTDLAKCASKDCPRWVTGICDRGVFVQDRDFTHDARLYLNGDFGEAAATIAFAEQVAFALNREFGWDMTPSADTEDDACTN